MAGLFDVNTGGVIKEAGSAVGSVLSGLGTLAVKLRTAFTGKVDPETQAALEELSIQLDAAAAAGQVEVNKIEASSASVFVAGWRPFIGWICGISLGSYYIPQALIAAILWATQCFIIMYQATDLAAVKLPVYPLLFDMGEIIGLVASLLGLAGMRSWDKKQAICK